MTVQEVIEVLESDGWRPTKNDEGHRQFVHDTKRGPVTLSGKLELSVPPGVLSALLRYAQLEEAD